ncbi:phosphate acetyltransferase [Telmatospirillum siberiense]|uniref:Phosphate acetyltransferase n=1 Tax=Telmatospirillum siberiense TaxID=382514 RepID=A0A2N3PVS8_9PROT|nr:phosphate acetyltransferase [Telmatospirillum siberiense]
MDSPSFFVVPAARDVGPRSVSLGLVRALQREGIDVGFIKPISSPEAAGARVDLACHFGRSLCHLDVPEPIPFALAEERVRSGQLSELMEDVVTLAEAASQAHDVVVIQGIPLDFEAQLASQLNIAMAGCLSARMVVVVNALGRSCEQLAEDVAAAVRLYGDGGRNGFAGVVLNQIAAGEDGRRLVAGLRAKGDLPPLLACVPFDAGLSAPRLADVVEELGLTVEREGNLAQSRVQEIAVAGSAVENAISWLRPGTLLVTSGDRSDIILATALAYLRGIPLAGLLLTCGRQPAPPIASLISASQLSGLPILRSEKDTYGTSILLAGLNRHVTRNDPQRMEQAIQQVTESTDIALFKDIVGKPGTLRLTPPAFRHRLVQSAHIANKRIVLPEGDEPRTLRAAVICHEKGIAHCVLLGEPARIREIAGNQGLTLPPDIEIIDAMAVRENYVAPLVEMRKSKGLTPQQARDQLEDTVVLGTVMLAVGEVDGLVSGAVHTTASTVRPALQLIKTAPGQSIVSSVFFMLMPDQVLVYGDCAINPNPSAEQLADIAIQSAGSARAFGIEPRVAMISYSTGTSGVGDDVDKVREATRIVHERCPDLMIDGPIQYDAASVESVGRQKAPESLVAGRANVFVFPDLNTGNTTYKAVQRSANVVSVGPMLQGLRKPVNDLSRGALVDDIVYTIALTAIQANQTG